MRDIRVDGRERVYDGFFKMDRFSVTRITETGETSMVREVFQRGHSAALLPYDPKMDFVLVVEEFRIGHLAAGHPVEDCWSPGPIAGIIDAGETPQNTVLREAVEEAGLAMGSDDLFDPMTIMPSPGGCSEVVSLFLGLTDLSKITGGRYGSGSEQEETHTRLMTRVEALRLVTTKPISGHLTSLVLRLEMLRLSGAFER